MILKKNSIHVFSCYQKSKDRRQSGCRGTPYVRRYDRELVLKPAISLKEKLGELPSNESRLKFSGIEI